MWTSHRIFLLFVAVSLSPRPMTNSRILMVVTSILWDKIRRCFLGKVFTLGYTHFAKSYTFWNSFL